MAVKAHILGPGTLRLGETGTEVEFSAQATNIRLSPSANEEDGIPVLSGEEVDGDESIDWTLGGSLLQSFDREGLIHWCYTNRLKTVQFEFIPSKEESDYGWRGLVKVLPLEVGGDVKKKNTTNFEFKCKGEPVPFDVPA